MQPRRSSGPTQSGLLASPDIDNQPKPNTQSDSPNTSRRSSRKRPCPRPTLKSTSSPPPEPSEPEQVHESEEHSECEEATQQSKEERYEESRSLYRTKFQFYPELFTATKTPLTCRYYDTGSMTRSRHMHDRKFINQQCISACDENLADVRRIVTGAGLIHTLTDVDAYQPNVVKEFIAHIDCAEERGDGVAVFVRGLFVDFSPSLINAIFCIPGFEDDPNWKEEDIDEVCGFLTNGRIQRWENMSSKFLTPTNQVLYKLVCTNWIPTMNYTAMNQERLKFVYMLYHIERGFNFGKLVYDQIVKMGKSIAAQKSRRIIFPTLIQQVIQYQRLIPVDYPGDDFVGMPKFVVKDTKAGRGTGSDNRAASLEEDIDKAIADLKSIRLRLRRGEYGPRSTQVEYGHEDTEENEDEEAGTEELDLSD